MLNGRGAGVMVLTAATGIAAVGCSSSRPTRTTDMVSARQSPTPPTTSDPIALYNDTRSTVHVVGCLGCGVSGTALEPGRWLPLNLLPDSVELKIQQPTRMTCLVILNGVDHGDGKPLTVKVSDSAASAC